MLVRVKIGCGSQTISAVQEWTEAIAAPFQKHSQVRCCGECSGLEKLRPVRALTCISTAIPGETHGSGEGTTDLPMVPKRIDDAAETPVMLFCHRIDFFRASLNCPSENRVRIGNRENDANRDAAKRLRTEIEMFGGLVAEPEFCALDGKTGDDIAIIAHAEDLNGSESGLVKVDGAGSVTDAEPGRNGSCQPAVGH